MSVTTSSTTAGRTDLALTIARVVLAAIMIVHGAVKLFGFGLGGTIGFFTQVGAPLPTVTAPLIIALEFGGGIALLFGLLSRWVTLAFVIDMLGAITLVHWKNGFMGGMGVEFPLALIALALTIAVAGPGAYSLDQRLATRRAR